MLKRQAEPALAAALAQSAVSGQTEHGYTEAR